MDFEAKVRSHFDNFIIGQAKEMGWPLPLPQELIEKTRARCMATEWGKNYIEYLRRRYENHNLISAC